MVIHFYGVIPIKRGCNIAAVIITVGVVLIIYIIIATWKLNVIISIIGLTILREGLAVTIERYKSTGIVRVKGMNSFNYLICNGEGGPLAIEICAARNKAHRPPTTLGISDGMKVKSTDGTLSYNIVITIFICLEISPEFELPVILKTNGLTYNNSA